MIGTHPLHRCTRWVKYGPDWAKRKGNMFHISNIGRTGHRRVVTVNLKGNIHARLVFTRKL